MNKSMTHLKCKIILAFMLLSIGSSFADSDIYKDKLSVTLEDVTFDEVVTAIENQSEYVFFYKSSDVDHSIQYDVELNNKSIIDILDQLTKNSSLTYRISGKYIFIDKKKENAEEINLYKVNKVTQQRN